MNNIGSIFYNLNNRHCENSLMIFIELIFIELHMRSSSEHAHILHGSKPNVNVETTFFELKFVISLLKLVL